MISWITFEIIFLKKCKSLFYKYVFAFNLKIHICISQQHLSFFEMNIKLIQYYDFLGQMNQFQFL